MPSHTRPVPTAMLARAGVAVLFLVGALAVLVRGAYPTDAAQQLEPLRAALLRVFDSVDPAAAARPAQVARFDAPFAAHPVATALHLGAAVIWLLLTPLQLSDRVRAGQPALHRASGRLVLVAGGVLTLSGLYFGFGRPFAGWREAVVVGLASVWFVIANVRAIRAIRRGEVARHRRWMLRAVAVPLGVTVVRLVGLTLELVLVGSAVDSVGRFLLSIWVGWPLTIGSMELWLRHNPRTERLTSSLPQPQGARVA